MKGVIIINPYLVPENSLHQANRLSNEFNALGVKTEIVSNGFLRSVCDENGLKIQFDCDFIIYLDKDKYLSSILEKKGYRLFNCHKAIRVCDDKAQTYIALADNGVAVPKTMFGALCFRQEKPVQEEWADEIIKNLGLPVIVKECYGSLGANVFMAQTKAELLKLMEQVKLKPHLFQEYLDAKKGTDIRVIVVGKKVKGAMVRHNPNDFRSNIAIGGGGEKIELTKPFIEIAEKCANVLDLDYCGVDILYGKNNQPVVCEVNSNAFFDGIEKVTGVNVAKEYAQYVIDCITKE